MGPQHDPWRACGEFQRVLGGRATVVVIPRCSHTAVAEQPQPIADALIAYARSHFRPCQL